MGGPRYDSAPQQRCWFQLPPLERYRRLMANYADQWAAADEAKRIDHLRYAWRRVRA